MHGEELPTPGDTFELVLAAIVEFEPRTRDQVGECPRDKDLVGFGEIAHALADVDGDAGDIVASYLDLAGVKPGPDGHSDRGQRVADGHRGPYPLCWPVERREHAIASRR